MFTLFEIYLPSVTQLTNKNCINTLFNCDVKFYDETVIDTNICYTGKIETNRLLMKLTAINSKFTSYRYTTNKRLCIVIDLTTVVSIDLVNLHSLYPDLYDKKKI